MSPCSISHIPTNLEKSWNDIIIEVSHDKYHVLDKNRIIKEKTLKTLLKKTYPELEMTEMGLKYLLLLVQNITDTISMNAINYTKLAKRKTIDSRDIQNAIKLSIPKQLEEVVLSEGIKAITKYKSW